MTLNFQSSHLYLSSAKRAGLADTHHKDRFYAGPGIEPKVSCMLGKHFLNEANFLAIEIILILLYLFTLYMNVGRGIHVEIRLCEPLLSYQVGPGELNSNHWLGSKHLYPLSHFTGPNSLILEALFLEKTKRKTRKLYPLTKALCKSFAC